MPTSQQNTSLLRLLRMIPPKWALGIVIALVAYSLTQPWLNRTLKWNLPSLTTSVGRETESSNSNSAVEAKPTSQTSSPNKPTAPSADTPLARSSGRGVGGEGSSVTKADSKSNTNSAETKVGSKSSANRVDSSDLAAKLGVTGDSDLRFGYLKEIGRERYQSPQGLIYTQGSDEGHRLKHIQRHLKDQPDRPGSHGVFNGDMPQVLRWIDETYQKAVKGDRMAKKRQEDESTIYELTFDKPIGYLGGIEGRRRKNPPAKRLRLVVIDRNVITAFPF